MSELTAIDSFSCDAEIQISVVAKVMTPNLSPILDRRFKTRKVILIHTSDFTVEANRLAEIYKQYQITTEFFPVSSAFDLQVLRFELEKLFLNLVHLDDAGKSMVNVTCGTKLQSLVLYEMAMALEMPVYYMNPDDSVSWLWPKNMQALQLEDRIKLPAFLKAHGWEVQTTESPASDKHLREMLDDLICNLERYKKAIPKLNGIALQAKSNLMAELEDIHQEKALSELLENLEARGLLQRRNNKVYFKDEESRFFANGGWLEEYVYHQIRQLSSKLPEIQDNLTGTYLTHFDSKVANEIDNLILANNHLYVIECKTKKFKPDSQVSATDSIYKLETLMHQLGGSLARAMLVTVYPVSKADRARAKHYGIEVVALGDIAQLKSKLTSWISGHKFY